MIPARIWNAYSRLLTLEKKHVIMESHLDFLENCKRKKVIPKGLKYKPKVNYATLHTFCQHLLDKVSSTMINKIIKYLKQERNKNNVAKLDCRKEVNDITNGDFRYLAKRAIDKSIHTKESLKVIKERKLSSLQSTNAPAAVPRTQGNDSGNVHRQRRRRHNKRKRNAKSKRARRNAKLLRKQNDFVEQLQNLTLPPQDRFKPFDNTGYNMNDIEKQVCAKGLKFVPTVKRVDLFQKMVDFERFARSLRLAVFFQDKSNNTVITDIKPPWSKKSTFMPPTNNARLEEYLLAVRNDLFNPINFNKVTDNLTPEQRVSLNELRTWNSDESNPRLFRCQDKGARLVIDFKERYHQKITDYLEDRTTFREDERDLTADNKLKVSQWADKWYQLNEIPSDVTE